MNEHLKGFRCSLFLAAALLPWGSGQAFGQEEAQAEGRLVDRLKSTNAVVAAKAVQEVINGAWNPPGRLRMYNELVPALMSVHRYDEAVEVAQAGILNQPQDIRCLEILQDKKITALLVIGRNTEALAEARALYNLCPMHDTPWALQRVEECLAAVYPDKPEILERFRKEQKEGSLVPGTAADGDAAPAGPIRSTVMDAIRVDYNPCERMGKHDLVGHGGRLLAKANLLLMANRPQEAREIFEQMLATPPEWPPADVVKEGLARCMKAEDGTSGRAAAWWAKQRAEK